MNIFQGKRVLITGNTGFKGSWLSIWLLELGADVVGYALKPVNQKDNFVLSGLDKKLETAYADIRDYRSLLKTFNDIKPDVVFHLAAQPIVRESYLEPRYTYEVNVMGTVNVLDCIRLADYPISAVIVTSDKCYKNVECIYSHRENDALGGADPYSASKSCDELIAESYSTAFFTDTSKAIATVRAGNVIGGGDWAIDRIVPDCIRSLESNNKILLRNPLSIRPWQHVLEPLKGYISIAENLLNDENYTGAWNFGPNSNSIISVKSLAEEIVNCWGGGNIELVQNDNKAMHEVVLLSLDNSKAKHFLGWQPQWDIKKTINKTVEWYKSYPAGNVYDLCFKQITEYDKFQ